MLSKGQKCYSYLTKNYREKLNVDMSTILYKINLVPERNADIDFLEQLADLNYKNRKKSVSNVNYLRKVIQVLGHINFLCCASPFVMVISPTSEILLYEGGHRSKILLETLRKGKKITLFVIVAYNPEVDALRLLGDAFPKSLSHREQQVDSYLNVKEECDYKKLFAVLGFFGMALNNKIPGKRDSIATKTLRAIYGKACIYGAQLDVKRLHIRSALAFMYLADPTLEGRLDRLVHDLNTNGMDNEEIKEIKEIIKKRSRGRTKHEEYATTLMLIPYIYAYCNNISYRVLNEKSCVNEVLNKIKEKQGKANIQVYKNTLVHDANDMYQQRIVEDLKSFGKINFHMFCKGWDYTDEERVETRNHLEKFMLDGIVTKSGVGYAVEYKMRQ